MMRRRKTQIGFSLIEVMFAIAILGVGLCAIMAMFGNAVYSMKYAQEDQIAKQKAREALEAAISARNEGTLQFDDLQNVSNGGIFKDGFGLLYLAGDNGVPGTGKDTAILDRFRFPGPNGILGDDDDYIMALTNYQRKIVIANVLNADGSVNNDMRKITVTVTVTDGTRGTKAYTVSSFISRFN